MDRRHQTELNWRATLTIGSLVVVAAALGLVGSGIHALREGRELVALPWVEMPVDAALVGGTLVLALAAVAYAGVAAALVNRLGAAQMQARELDRDVEQTGSEHSGGVPRAATARGRSDEQHRCARHRACSNTVPCGVSRAPMAASRWCWERA